MSHPEYKDIGDPAIHLIEECAELVKAVCKGQRFGWDNHYPGRPDMDNVQAMDAEMADVAEAYNALKKEILSLEGRKGDD